MPAKSKSQQRAAGMALAAKRGEMEVSKLKGAAKEMYDSMSEKELKKFAETERKGLPDKVSNESIIKLKDLIKENDVEKSIINFFKKNPNPPDDKVHALAKQLDIKPDEFEEKIYKLLSKSLVPKDE